MVSKLVGTVASPATPVSIPCYHSSKRPREKYVYLGILYTGSVY